MVPSKAIKFNSFGFGFGGYAVKASLEENTNVRLVVCKESIFMKSLIIYEFLEEWHPNNQK